MNKEELKKEYINWLIEKRSYTSSDDTADFWLSKLDAYQSSLLERIEGMKPILWNDNPNRHLENVAKYNTIDDIITLIKEGKE